MIGDTQVMSAKSGGLPRRPPDEPEASMTDCFRNGRFRPGTAAGDRRRSDTDPMERRGWVVGAVVLAVLAGGTALGLQRRTGTEPGPPAASATGLRPGPPIYLDRSFSPAERAADL